MTVVSSKIFAENPIHYLNLSKVEDVAIKRGKTRFRIMPEDPEDDPYWDDPRNVEEVMQILKDRDEGKLELFPLTPELKKELFGK